MTVLRQMPFLLRLSVDAPTPTRRPPPGYDADAEVTSLPPVHSLTATRSQITSTYADPTSDEQTDR